MVQGTQIYVPLTGSELGVTGHHSHKLPLYVTHHLHSPALPSPRPELPYVFTSFPTWDVSEYPDTTSTLPDLQPHLSGSLADGQRTTMGRARCKQTQPEGDRTLLQVQ